jgi:hypothetical protein
MRYLAYVLLITSLFSHDRLTADVITVPADHPTIGEAINAAESGDVILVGPGTWYENLFIVKSLVLQGAADGTTIIDGSTAKFGGGSCATVASVSVEIRSMVLRNGTGSEIFGRVRGGGIYIEFGSLHVVDVVIENCSVDLLPFKSEGWGGAICGYGSDISIENCILRDNHSGTSGGAIWSGFGSLEIMHTVIASNVADMAGGAIFSRDTDVTISGSRVCGNTAGQTGGAIDHEMGTLLVDRTVLTGNTAVDGAALFVTEGSSVTNSEIIGSPLAEGSFLIHVSDAPEADPFSIGNTFFCGHEKWIFGGSGSYVETAPNEFNPVCPEPEDLNRDGLVGGADLTLLLSAWGTEALLSGGDIDCSGLVDGGDLARLLAGWSSS